MPAYRGGLEGRIVPVIDDLDVPACLTRFVCIWKSCPRLKVVDPSGRTSNVATMCCDVPGDERGIRKNETTVSRSEAAAGNERGRASPAQQME